MNKNASNTIFSKHNIEAAIILGSDPNFLYLIGQEMREATIIITRKKLYLLHSPLEKPIMKGATLIATKKSCDTIIDIIKKEKVKTVGLNEDEISHSLAKKIHCKKIDIKSTLANLRTIKTKQEIELMRTAADITCDIMNNLLNDLKKNIENEKWNHERDILQYLKIETIKRDCTLAFEPIVASGEHASTPHYQDAKPLQKGFLIIDFGVRYKGYCCDMTRTVHLGTPSQNEREQYSKVLACQESCIKMLSNHKNATRKHSDLTGKDVDTHARKVLGPDAKYFTHSLGHGVGIEVHEEPRLSQKGGKLIEGNVVTVEPGIYYNENIRKNKKERNNRRVDKGILKKIRGGIRIEDVIFLGRTNEVLTKRVQKELFIIRKF